jgi:hypothetical protein
MGKSQKLGNMPNAPAFSAYANASTSIPTAAITKVNFAVEDFDTNSNFASSRFTPTVAGYYQINASVQFTGSTTNPLCYITKNGLQVKCGSYTTGSFTGPVSVASGLVYLNGSTDYVEVAAYHATGSSVNTLAAADTTRFDGCLVRPA